MNEQSKQVRPFGMADKIGYAFGDFGNDFIMLPLSRPRSEKTS